MMLALEPNKAKALGLLSSKIYDIEKQKLEQEKASERKSLVGTGDRSEKIRTYNYPQGRITDHRLKLTLYNIDNFIDGEIDEEFEGVDKAQFDSVDVHGYALAEWSGLASSFENFQKIRF